HTHSGTHTQDMPLTSPPTHTPHVSTNSQVWETRRTHCKRNKQMHTHTHTHTHRHTHTQRRINQSHYTHISHSVQDVQVGEEEHCSNTHTHTHTHTHTP